MPAQAQSGEELAEGWCSACHVYPPPQLLDRKTWLSSVLPDMGARLGFATFRGFDFHRDENAPEGTYADEPVMDEADWQKIVSFIETAAPDTLVRPDWPERARLDLFTIELPAKPANDFPTNPAVFIDESAKRVLVGDGFGGDVEIYGSDLVLEREVAAGGAVSRIARLPSGDYLAARIGETIGPTEAIRGELIGFSANASTGAEPEGAATVLPGLHRPVDMVFDDFNADGHRDYVTADYGAYTGGVVLYLGQPDGGFSSEVLLDGPGASVLELDGDDLWILQAQALERIVRIKDFADEVARDEEWIFEFPPSFGSTGLAVRDVDGDGLRDLVYTAGDNADMTPIFKPYHGIYIFAGQADGSFERQMFFPLDGAYAAAPQDFDADGDIDIAAFAYYPDLGRGIDQSVFVYLENTGTGFEARYVEGLGSLGRFIAISTGDVDGDGDIDIALANLSASDNGPMTVPGALQRQWIEGPHFVLLRNGLR